MDLNPPNLSRNVVEAVNAASHAAITPARILETGMAFWPSKVLLTAV